MIRQNLFWLFLWVSIFSHISVLGMEVHDSSLEETEKLREKLKIILNITPEDSTKEKEEKVDSLIDIFQQQLYSIVETNKNLKQQNQLLNDSLYKSNLTLKYISEICQNDNDEILKMISIKFFQEQSEINGFTKIKLFNENLKYQNIKLKKQIEQLKDNLIHKENENKELKIENKALKELCKTQSDLYSNNVVDMEIEFQEKFQGQNLSQLEKEKMLETAKKSYYLDHESCLLYGKLFYLNQDIDENMTGQQSLNENQEIKIDLNKKYFEKISDDYERTYKATTEDLNESNQKTKTNELNIFQNKEIQNAYENLNQNDFNSKTTQIPNKSTFDEQNPMEDVKNMRKDFEKLDCDIDTYLKQLDTNFKNCGIEGHIESIKSASNMMKTLQNMFANNENETKQKKSSQKTKKKKKSEVELKKEVENLLNDEILKMKEKNSHPKIKVEINEKSEKQNSIAINSIIDETVMSKNSILTNSNVDGMEINPKDAKKETHGIINNFEIHNQKFKNEKKMNNFKLNKIHENDFLDSNFDDFIKETENSDQEKNQVISNYDLKIKSQKQNISKIDEVSGKTLSFDDSMKQLEEVIYEKSIDTNQNLKIQNDKINISNSKQDQKNSKFEDDCAEMNIKTISNKKNKHKKDKILDESKIETIWQKVDFSEQEFSYENFVIEKTILIDNVPIENLDRKWGELMKVFEEKLKKYENEPFMQEFKDFFDNKIYYLGQVEEKRHEVTCVIYGIVIFVLQHEINIETMKKIDGAYTYPIFDIKKKFTKQWENYSSNYRRKYLERIKYLLVKYGLMLSSVPRYKEIKDLIHDDEKAFKLFIATREAVLNSEDPDTLYDSLLMQIGYNFYGPVKIVGELDKTFEKAILLRKTK